VGSGETVTDYELMQARFNTSIKFMAEFGVKPARSKGTTICPHCGGALNWSSGRRSVFFRYAKPDCFEAHSRGGVSKPERKLPVQKQDDIFNLGSVPDEW
jgi:hypothetical protein